MCCSGRRTFVFQGFILRNELCLGHAMRHQCQHFDHTRTRHHGWIDATHWSAQHATGPKFWVLLHKLDRDCTAHRTSVDKRRKVLQNRTRLTHLANKTPDIIYQSLKAVLGDMSSKFASHHQTHLGTCIRQPSLSPHPSKSMPIHIIPRFA